MADKNTGKESREHHLRSKKTLNDATDDQEEKFDLESGELHSYNLVSMKSNGMLCERNCY